MSTHNLCFEQKYEKYQNFLSEHFQCLVVKFSVNLNRRVFVMFVFVCIFNHINIKKEGMMWTWPKSRYEKYFLIDMIIVKQAVLKVSN